QQRRSVTESAALSTLVTDILAGGRYFLGGVQQPSASLPQLLTAIVQWGGRLNRSLEEIAAVIEPCLRQSVLMTLIPSRAVEPEYYGSIDAAIEEHLLVLGITVRDEEMVVLRNVCLHIRKYHGMDSRAARNATMSLAEIRGQPALYRRMLSLQNGRCLWCGGL